MSIWAHVDGLGTQVEECIADSVIAWRKEFKPGSKIVDTFAEALYSVETTISLRPAGVILLTVQVNGTGFLEASTQCFRLQRGRCGRWKVTASSLNAK